MYVVDTNVISELRRLRPHGGVIAWVKSVPDGQLHLSVITLGELQAGVELAREHDPARAENLERWIEQSVEPWSILPMDGRTFRVWARLMHRRSKELSGDAMIAATAIIHGLTVVTRNVLDFSSFGVDTLDPFTHK